MRDIVRLLPKPVEGIFSDSQDTSQNSFDGWGVFAGPNLLKTYKELGWAINIRIRYSAKRAGELSLDIERDANATEYVAVANFVPPDEKAQIAGLDLQIPGRDSQDVQSTMLVSIVELCQGTHRILPSVVRLQRLDNRDIGVRHTRKLPTLQCFSKVLQGLGDRKLVHSSRLLSVSQDKVPDKLIERRTYTSKEIAGYQRDLRVRLWGKGDSLEEYPTIIVLLHDKGAMAICTGATQDFHVREVFLCAN